VSGIADYREKVERRRSDGKCVSGENAITFDKVWAHWLVKVVAKVRVEIIAGAMTSSCTLRWGLQI